mgnify:CR=1 FL=1
MIVNQKGIAIKTTMDLKETIEYGSMISQFTHNAYNYIDSLHPGEEITFIRIRSKLHEIMIAPEKEFSLIVLQNPSNDENNWNCSNISKYTPQMNKTNK